MCNYSRIGELTEYSSTPICQRIVMCLTSGVCPQTVLASVQFDLSVLGNVGEISVSHSIYKRKQV